MGWHEGGVISAMELKGGYAILYSLSDGPGGPMQTVNRDHPARICQIRSSLFHIDHAARVGTTAPSQALGSSSCTWQDLWISSVFSSSNFRGLES